MPPPKAGFVRHALLLLATVSATLVIFAVAAWNARNIEASPDRIAARAELRRREAKVGNILELTRDAPQTAGNIYFVTLPASPAYVLIKLKHSRPMQVACFSGQTGGREDEGLEALGPDVDIGGAYHVISLYDASDFRSFRAGFADWIDSGCAEAIHIRPRILNGRNLRQVTRDLKPKGF
jgi:hypothetical protein